MSAYTLNPDATGFVTVLKAVQQFIPDSVCYIGYATGLYPNVESFLLDGGSRQCDTKNGCGTHIHEGPSCATKDLQGSHYYDESELAEDPWQREAFLSTGSSGETAMIGCVIDGIGATGFGDSRAFILHDHLGDRVLCGLLIGEDYDGGDTLTSNGGDSSSSSDEFLPGSSDEEEGATPSGSSSDEGEGSGSSSEELGSSSDEGEKSDSSSDEGEGSDSSSSEEGVVGSSSSSSNEEEGSSSDEGNDPFSSDENNETSSSSSDDKCKSMEDIICSTEYADTFSTMCGLLKQADLDDILSSSQLTAFVPTDKAFKNFGLVAEKSGADVASVSKGYLYDILSFHFIKDFVIPTDHLVCKELHEMANGKDSRTRCEDETPPPHVKFQKGAGNKDLKALPEIMENIVACNGIIHSVSEVMLSEK